MNLLTQTLTIKEFIVLVLILLALFEYGFLFGVRYLRDKLKQQGER